MTALLVALSLTLPIVTILVAVQAIGTRDVKRRDARTIRAHFLFVASLIIATVFYVNDDSQVGYLVMGMAHIVIGFVGAFAFAVAKHEADKKNASHVSDDD